MKDAILLELAARWEKLAEPEKVSVQVQSLSDALSAGKAAGRREELRACADTLRTLVSVLGTDS